MGGGSGGAGGSMDEVRQDEWPNGEGRATNDKLVVKFISHCGNY